MNDSVKVGGKEVAAIGRKFENKKDRPLATQRQYLLSGLGVPQLDRFLAVAAGGEPLAVGRVGHRMHAEEETAEIFDRLQGRHIPKLNEAFSISRRQRSAIGRQGQTVKISLTLDLPRSLVGLGRIKEKQPPFLHNCKSVRQRGSNKIVHPFRSGDE